MIRVNDEYKARLFLGTGFAAMFNGGCIELYAGTMPDSPDIAAPPTVIARITNNGGSYTHGSPVNGLNYAVTPEGRVIRATGASWVLSCLNTGVPTWGRIYGQDDPLVTASDAPRIDFSVNPTDGTGSGIFLANPSLTAGGQQPCTFFSFGIPPF